MNANRKKAELLAYQTMDQLDTTGQNTAYYKEKFAKMDDKEFYEFVSLPLCIKFQHKAFEVEPTMEDINNALEVLKVPLLEKVNLGFLYKNKDGVPVKSKECMVVPVPVKKMKQFLTKKNSMSTDISQRDMKTGLLINFDKNGATSDREMEGLNIMELDYTITEFSRFKADSMDAKNEMYNTISNTGMVSIKNMPVSVDDSLSKNLLNVYLIGCMLDSNLISEDYHLPITLKDKKKSVERET